MGLISFNGSDPRNYQLRQIIWSNNLFVRFEVFSAVTVKNTDFWDINTQSVPHRRHITSPLQRPAG
jgi:hypothetical protein